LLNALRSWSFSTVFANVCNGRSFAPENGIQHGSAQEKDDYRRVNKVITHSQTQSAEQINWRGLPIVISEAPRDPKMLI